MIDCGLEKLECVVGSSSTLMKPTLQRIDKLMTNQQEIRAIIQRHATRGDIYNRDEGEEFDKAELALRALQQYSDDLIPMLVVALSDPDEAVRQVVMRLFWELDTNDECVLPAMIKSLKDRNRSIRHAAAGFVTRFGERAGAAIPILQSWIENGDEMSRILATGNILKIDPSKSGKLLPVLIDALGSDGIEQIEAIGQLEGLGEMSQEAVPSLKRLLHEDSTVSLQAADAIHAITGDPTDSITVGVALLDHSEWLDRYVGAEHLGLLGAMARPAIPRLKRTVLDDENEAVRNRAKVALAEIGM
ncbi:MAG: HEAT repeat domain-containing protein [Fuerstiella sp.]